MYLFHHTQIYLLNLFLTLNLIDQNEKETTGIK